MASKAITRTEVQGMLYFKDDFDTEVWQAYDGPYKQATELEEEVRRVVLELGSTMDNANTTVHMAGNYLSYKDCTLYVILMRKMQNGDYCSPDESWWRLSSGSTGV